MDQYNKKKQNYSNLLIYAGVVVAVLLLMKYVVPYFLPFLVAVVIVVPLHRLCLRKGWCRKKGKGIMAGGVLFSILLFVLLLFIGFGTFFFSRTQNFIQNIAVIEAECIDLISDFCHRLEVYSGLGNGVVEAWLHDKIFGLFGNLAIESSSWISNTLRYLAGMGRLFTLGLVTFICVVLFAREIDRWQQGLLNVAVLEPAIDRVLSIIIRIGKKLGGMMKTFIKTQSVILCCISVTAGAGLFLAGISEFWFYGLLAGVMDVLPFIGTGIVLVPIGVIQLLGGNYLQAMIVFVAYVLCIVIREVLEPRLMGNGLQVSPVAILVSVYAGVLFYGIGGVLLGPVTLLILVEFAREIFGKKLESSKFD